MEAPSELEQFLKSQQAAGHTDSEGSFTVSREESLRKLAQFQLPFEIAWAVKVIQCAVADGRGTPIRVDLKVKEAHFYFGCASLDIDQLETAFYDPENKLHPAGKHLVSALWAVGLHLKLCFQLALPNSATTLIWDGKALHRVESKTKFSCAQFVVSFQTSGALEWIKGLAQSGARNAEILQTISKWCFTCPVPLTVDGRRLDSLQHCPSHGISHSSFPFSILFAQTDLEPVAVPPGTFQYRRALVGPEPSNLLENRGGGMQRVGEQMLAQLKPVEKAPLPFILNLNFELETKGDRQVWKRVHKASTVYWVRDGVVVDQDRLTAAHRSHCATAIFLNADGLASDATTFQLLQSSERAERIAKARRTVIEQLADMTEISDAYESVRRSIKFKGKLVGAAAILFGVGLAWTGTWLAIGFLGGGAIFTGSASSRAESIFENLETEINNLRFLLEGNWD